MDQKKSQILVIEYSSLLDRTLVRRVIYPLQFILIFFQLSNTVFLSNKITPFQQVYIKYIEKNYSKIICKTLQLGFILSFFTKKIELDNTSLDKKARFSQPEYEHILFTLLFSSNSDLVIKKLIVT